MAIILYGIGGGFLTRSLATEMVKVPGRLGAKDQGACQALFPIIARDTCQVPAVVLISPKFLPGMILVALHCCQICRLQARASACQKLASFVAE